MKILKNILFVTILSFLAISTVNAQSVDYKSVYMEYLSSYKVDEIYPEKVLFYDLNNDGMPEMLLEEIKPLGDEINTDFKTICHIYTIKNNKLEKISTIENKTDYIFGDNTLEDTIVLFTTNNDKNLYYGFQDFDVNYNMTYYKLNYDNNKVTSTLVGKTQTNFFKDLKEKHLDTSKDKYFINNKLVSQNEFLQKLNFKQSLNFISLKNMQKVKNALNNYNNLPANPTYTFNIKSYENENNYGSIDVNHIIYNNGLYDYFKDDIYLLMINGNIIPKGNVITEGDKIYLPLRTICNYINKDIIYNSKNNSITIDNITINLKTGKMSNNQKANMKSVNGVTYLSSDFFKKYLDFNISTVTVNEGKNNNTENNKPSPYSVNIINLEEGSLKINYAPIDPLKEDIKNIKLEEPTLKIGDISKPKILGRYYFFKTNINYFVGEEHIESFDTEKYFIYDNYSNIKYWE